MAKMINYLKLVIIKFFIDKIKKKKQQHLELY